MVILNGQSNMPNHRQNRRRERPGSRTRRSMNRKANAPLDYTDCLLDAHDTSVYLPSYRPSPSPLLRQNFDQSWQRWQARKMEEKVLAEMDRIQLQADQQRLFGEDICDEELYRMGILYDNDEDITKDHLQNKILCDFPAQASVPSFIIRHGKPKRSRQRSTQRSLPLYLSFSGLSDDADIARLLSSTTTTSPNIQHSTKIPLMSFNTIIPQSLPTPSLSAFGSGSLYGSHFLDNTTFSVSTPTHPFENDPNCGDWTLIQTTNHDSTYSTPASEPETWILIDDS